MSNINFEKAQVKELGEKIGYGNMMSLASELWKESLKQKSYPENGAFVPKLEIKLNDPSKTPNRSANDSNYSEDVFIIDEEGMLGLAYFQYENMGWRFHTDTLVDYNEKGNETKWKWFYSPVSLSECGF